MDLFAALLAMAGSLIMLWACIAIYVSIFRKGLGWFIFCIVIPPIGLIIFCIMNLKDSAKPISISLLGLLVFFSASFISPEFYASLAE